MEGKNQKVINILDGLVQINNDRISGYHQASQGTNDIDLEQLFTSMLNESINFAENLEAYIKDLGGRPTSKGTTKGKFHQAWLNFTAALLGNDREELLASCELGDKTAIEAYQTAMQTKEIEENEELRGVLMRQQANLDSSLKIVKKLHPRTNSTQKEQDALKLM
jgi:uncharacterized protein (TIGR02284 family)